MESGPSRISPSLVAIYRAQQRRPRQPPPAVSPLRDRSAFASDDEYALYQIRRRKAMERVREFQRPPRSRTGRDQSARARPAPLPSALPLTP